MTFSSVVKHSILDRYYVRDNGPHSLTRYWLEQRKDGLDFRGAAPAAYQAGYTRVASTSSLSGNFIWGLSSTGAFTRNIDYFFNQLQGLHTNWDPGTITLIYRHPEPISLEERIKRANVRRSTSSTLRNTNMAIKEIIYEPEDKPFIHKLSTNEDGSTHWHVELLPVLGVVAPDPDILVMPLGLWKIFNPISAELVDQIKEGDTARITVDIDHPLYQEWEAPPRFAPIRDYDKTFLLRWLLPDTYGRPVAIGEPLD